MAYFHVLAALMLAVALCEAQKYKHYESCTEADVKKAWCDVGAHEGWSCEEGWQDRPINPDYYDYTMEAKEDGGGYGVFEELIKLTDHRETYVELRDLGDLVTKCYGFLCNIDMEVELHEGCMYFGHPPGYCAADPAKGVHWPVPCHGTRTSDYDQVCECRTDESLVCLDTDRADMCDGVQEKWEELERKSNDINPESDWGLAPQSLQNLHAGQYIEIETLGRSAEEPGCQGLLCRPSPGEKPYLHEYECRKSLSFNPMCDDRPVGCVDDDEADEVKSSLVNKFFFNGHNGCESCAYGADSEPDTANWYNYKKDCEDTCMKHGYQGNSKYMGAPEWAPGK